MPIVETFHQKAGGSPNEKLFHHQVMKVASSEVACCLLSSQTPMNFHLIPNPVTTEQF
ncbi:MAG: hypothetical protein F6J86_24040 [Symploca sp. SIO1B1]|nr:hypothetical protein [Symploca sp. SIO2D2]NER22100.1 hypothetical protein [Symploca sp. SIO1C2]NER50814.1 hypothetical protein [Symploca sp. SIO1A3]NER96883.1 hypothetical protein [Symploca sp. SIO1B1]